MEKLAFGLSLLTVLYLVFVYLTAKTLWSDTHSKERRPTLEKEQKT